MTQLILASGSPRRKDLLKSVGLGFEVIVPNISEVRKRGEAPQDYVRRLAREKAGKVAEGLAQSRSSSWIVIAGDTTVVSPKGKVLEKPLDSKDAQRMLKLLQGETHTVLTGYCLLSSEQEVHRTVKSRVTLRKLSLGDIQRYIATGEPMDKAGSYAAQGFGMALISKLSGSYTNVVGLPMEQLLSDLEKKFGIPLFGKHASD